MLIEKKKTYQLKSPMKMISFSVIKVLVTHFGLLAHKHLNEMFPGKWIGRSGPSYLASMLTRFKPIELLSVGLCKVFSVLVCSG